jgi:recombination protein RecA
MRARARPIYARKLGVNVDDLLISQPDTGEQGLEIADALVARARSTSGDPVGAALVPRGLEGEMGDQMPGLQARLMTGASYRLDQQVHAMVIFINRSA